MPTIAQIKSAVCSHFGVSELDLDGNGRQPLVVYARQVGMWLARQERHRIAPGDRERYCGVKAIGDAFHKHHTSVTHAVRMMQNRLDVDGVAVRHDLEAIRAKL